MSDFLNTAAGSYVKVFLVVLLTLVLNQLSTGTTIFQLDWSSLANGAIVSFIPVIINSLNPKDTRYGKNKE